MSTWARKVHVWMDITIAPDDALQVARRLCGPGTHCVGMYVEDTALQRFASLPVARYVSRFSLHETQAAATTVQGELRARQSALQARFQRIASASAAGQAQVVTVPRQRLGEFVAPGDLLIVARPEAATWVGTRFTDLVEQLPGDLLFVNQPWDTGSRVAVLVRDSPAGRRALTVARELAGREGLETVALRSDPAATVPEDMPVHPLGAGVDNLLAACAGVDARVLVVPADASLDWSKVGVSMLERLDCSLLVVHEAQD